MVFIFPEPQVDIFYIPGVSGHHRIADDREGEKVEIRTPIITTCEFIE